MIVAESDSFGVPFRWRHGQVERAADDRGAVGHGDLACGRVDGEGPAGVAPCDGVGDRVVLDVGRDLVGDDAAVRGVLVDDERRVVDDRGIVDRDNGDVGGVRVRAGADGGFPKFP